MSVIQIGRKCPIDKIITSNLFPNFPPNIPTATSATKESKDIVVKSVWIIIKGEINDIIWINVTNQLPYIPIITPSNRASLFSASFFFISDSVLDMRSLS